MRPNSYKLVKVVCILLTFVGLSLIQLMFIILLKSFNTNISITLQESLDAGLYEAAYDQSSLLMRNLEKVGVIRCVNLQIQSNNSAIEIYKSVLFDDCNPSPLLMEGHKVEGSFKSRDGRGWIFSFVTPPSTELQLSLWIVRSLFLLFIFIVYSLLIRVIKTERTAKAKIDKHVRSIAHDLMSPLGSLKLIMSQPDILNQKKGKDLLKNATDRIIQISTSILEDGALVGGDFKSFDIIQPIKEIVEEKKTSLLLSERNVTINLTIKVKEPKIRVVGETEKFKRIISNIINNAVESYPKSNLHPLVNILIYKDSTTIFCEIIDEGVGISENILRIIGSKPISSHKHSGSGIGLYLARPCLLEWGGDLTISSELGAGTTVRLLFKIK